MARHAILQTFYASRKWRDLRMSLIIERGNKCERCGHIVPRSVDLIGHHKIELTPENVHDHMISLNSDKIEIICYECHNEEHQRFGYQTGKGVYIIYGPPFAGKKTFVKQNLRRGDLMIDMDALYSACSGLPFFDKPDNLFRNVIGIHNALIDQVKTRYGKWNSAWVIGGYADKFKRDRLANELGAELVFCDATKEECLRRLEQDEARKYRKIEWAGYIDKWFDQYTE